MGTRCTALLNKSCTAPHSLSLLIATACLAILVRSSSGGLYDASDRVDILDHSNFNASVYNTSRDFVYFIEFYNAWCGHCIHFAPTWKALGNSIVPWRQHVRLAAVDCNDQINLALCRQHEIRRVPALLFFMPHPSADSKGELCDCRQDEASLKRSILTYLSGLPFPRAIAPLKSIPKSPPSGTVLAVVVESAASSVGQNLVLALNGKNAHTTTAVRRFIADDVDQLAKFGVSTLPSLVVISKVGPPKVYKSRAVGEDSTATEFVRRILRIDPTLRTVHPVEAGISPRLKGKKCGSRFFFSRKHVTYVPLQIMSRPQLIRHCRLPAVQAEPLFCLTSTTSTRASYTRSSTKLCQEQRSSAKRRRR